MKAARVPILMYHRLGNVRTDSIVPGHYVTAKRFEGHLRTLRALGMTTVSLETMQDGFEGRATLPPKPVVVTFDDGYESFAEIGLPALRRQGMAATVFLVSDFVGGLNEWDLAKGDVEEPLMSRDRVLDASAGGIEFGSHTLRHADLPRLGRAEAEEEIRRSKLDLESWLGRRIDYFCYPYGAQNADVRAMVRATGHRGATSTLGHSNMAGTDPFEWGRINVRHNFTPFKLLRRLLKARRR